MTAVGNVDRTGANGKIMEVYPAVALSNWDFRAEGFRDGKPHERADLVADLEEQLEDVCPVGPKWIAKCEKYHDRLDALIAALVVRAFQLDETTKPEGEDEEKAAKVEKVGFTFLLAGSLILVLSARKDWPLSTRADRRLMVLGFGDVPEKFPI